METIARLGQLLNDAGSPTRLGEHSSIPAEGFVGNCSIIRFNGTLYGYMRSVLLDARARIDANHVLFFAMGPPAIAQAIGRLTSGRGRTLIDRFADSESYEDVVTWEGSEDLAAALIDLHEALLSLEAIPDFDATPAPPN